MEWSDEGVAGAHRFLKRVYSLVADAVNQRYTDVPFTVADLSPEARDLYRKLHETIAKVSDDIGRRYHFNTAIAAVMELVNQLQRFTPESAMDQAVYSQAIDRVVVLLSPITPHLSTHLWQALGQSTPLHAIAWPTVDTAALTRDVYMLVVQVNGKLRARIEVAAEATDVEILNQARAEQQVRKFLEGMTEVKTIIVPQKLVNLVVKPA